MYKTTLVAASGDVSKIVKPDGMIISMKIDCLNPANGADCLNSAHGAMLNYLCDFVVRDIKIAVYLNLPRKINFNLVNDFLST